MAATATKKKQKKRGRPHTGYSCPLLGYGKTYRGHNGWRIVYATEGARVNIKPEHIARAVKGSESHCVVALAFADYFGPDYDISVGVAVTKIMSEKDKVELRLKTPPAIGRAIDVWDHKKGWKLPPGHYRFGLLKPAKRRTTRATPRRAPEGRVPSTRRKTHKRTTIRDIVRNSRLKH